ncbi:MAG: hypothetical protein JNK77_17390 [Saprospiraceae bacterium]|nr:hypothetical protein [Saprospiraceae bacterium]
MKKLNYRTVLFVFLAMMSAASYLYLNAGATFGAGNVQQEENVLGRLSEEETFEEDQPAHTPLPDVHLLKKVVEGGRRFIPAH